MMRDSLTLWAPAKINLTLGVGACRADGYHPIRSIMQKISLYDTLLFSKAEEVTLSCDLKYLPTDERNLCVKAAKAYFAAAGIRGGVNIRIRKQIPVGAGLGGGSADAAVCLRALCRLYRPLPEQELYDLALTLGADVPFCLSEHNTCICEGVGEVLTPVTPSFSSPVFLLLVKNERKLSTGSVYQTFDELPTEPIPSDAEVLSALQAGDGRAMAQNLFNMLEKPVFSQKAALSALREKLLSLGALGARMSGAGPTVYGVFESMEQAQRASEHFSDASFCRVASLLV